MLDEQLLDNEDIELEIDEDQENEPEQNGVVEEEYEDDFEEEIENQLIGKKSEKKKLETLIKSNED